jgi:hypothetical protein
MLRFTYEALGACGLFATACLALLAWRRDDARFSLIAGLGTVYLGTDELFDLHERLGRYAYEHGWPRPGFVNHHDDLITMVVAAAGLAVIAWFWRDVVRDRQFAGLFLLGLGLFAVAVLVDTQLDQSGTGSWWTEESLELAGAASMMAAFWLRWRRAGMSGGVERVEI